MKYGVVPLYWDEENVNGKCDFVMPEKNHWLYIIICINILLIYRRAQPPHWNAHDRWRLIANSHIRSSLNASCGKATMVTVTDSSVKIRIRHERYAHSLIPSQRGTRESAEGTASAKLVTMIRWCRMMPFRAALYYRNEWCSRARAHAPVRHHAAARRMKPTVRAIYRWDAGGMARF